MITVPRYYGNADNIFFFLDAMGMNIKINGNVNPAVLFCSSWYTGPSYLLDFMLQGSERDREASSHLSCFCLHGSYSLVIYIVISLFLQ